MSSDTPAIRTPKRIAVIAVHGIADQSPGDTARAVADLLLIGDSNGTCPFRASDITRLRIATREVQTDVPIHAGNGLAAQSVNELPPEGGGSPSEQKKRKISVFDERSDYVRWLHTKGERKKQSVPQGLPDGVVVALNEDEAPEGGVRALRAAETSEEYAFGFMRDQLKEYRPTGADAVYETERLTLSLATEDEQCEVHVHEMYWADLSRLGSGFLRIFGELFHLFFDLANLGRQTVDFAWAEHAQDSRSERWWRQFHLFTCWTVRLLTLAVPILNLLLLAVTLMPLVSILPEGMQPPLALGVLGVATASAMGWYVLRRPQLSGAAWFLLPLLTGLAVALTSYYLVELGRDRLRMFGYYKLLALEWSIVLAGLVSWLLIAFERRRPGAKRLGLCFGIPVLLGTMIEILLTRDTPGGLYLAGLKLCEFIFLTLEVVWAGLLLSIWLAVIAGLVAIFRSQGDRSRATRAAFTTWLALTLPTSLFLIVTMIGYAALNQLAKYFFPPDLLFNPSPLFSNILPGFAPEMRALDFLTQLILVSATPGFVFMLLAMALAVVFAIWSLFPPVWSDIRPHRNSPAEEAQQLGNWLTRGYRLLGVSAILVFVALPVIVTLAAMINLLQAKYHFLPADSTGPTLTLLATAVMGSVSGVLAFHGRLERVALGFRPALDTILDVSNHLREFPRDANPRARISCRYVSLLRYLCAWRDRRDGGGYDGIVIVAHSQGTVISAELLRFLQRNPDQELDSLGQLNRDGSQKSGGIPILLLTMGCPLRQLYGWRFPHLYQWARHASTATWTNAQPGVIPPDQEPSPGALGVRKWVNAYRSGDYVGRYLWRPDVCQYQWTAPPLNLQEFVSEDLSDSRREFCLGAGGHTHYLDGTAPFVRQELVDLILSI